MRLSQTDYRLDIALRRLIINSKTNKLTGDGLSSNKCPVTGKPSLNKAEEPQSSVRSGVCGVLLFWNKLIHLYTFFNFYPKLVFRWKNKSLAK